MSRDPTTNHNERREGKLIYCKYCGEVVNKDSLSIGGAELIIEHLTLFTSATKIKYTAQYQCPRCRETQRIARDGVFSPKEIAYAVEISHQ